MRDIGRALITTQFKVIIYEFDSNTVTRIAYQNPINSNSHLYIFLLTYKYYRKSCVSLKNACFKILKLHSLFCHAFLRHNTYKNNLHTILYTIKIAQDI